MELLVVILVITVASAMILPELRGSLEETLLRDSARQVTGACTVARDRAVASGRTHRLRIEATSGRFRVEPDPGAGTGRSATPVDSPGASGVIDPRIVVRPLDVDTPDSPVTPPRRSGADAGEGLGFHADGTADAGGFLLQDRSGFRLALRVNPTTARVRVRDLGRP